MRIILLFCVFMIFACGEAVMVEVTGDERELYQSHLLLKAYFYHPERIKEFEEYRGMEVDKMYESLGDYFCGAHHEGQCYARYTFYLPPEETDDKIHDIENTKKYHSFGFERDGILNEDELIDTLVVTEVYPISPAASAGLKKHDRLLSANGISLIGLTTEKANAYLKDDEPYDDLTVFVVLRRGEVKTLKAMRKAEVQKPTIYLDSLEGIPYVRVTEYKVNTNNPDGTYAEFKKILQEINGAKTVIMDLRNNPGGNIEHCTSMAAELVPLNRELLYDVQHYYDTKRGNVIELSHEYVRDYLKQEGAGVNIKWIILISEWSASCSERFTAAVKYNRPETVIIGQTSYGKGIGQIYTKTYLGGLAYITCLQSYYPDGTTFHNIGILPDIPTDPEDKNAPLDVAIEIAKGNSGFAAKLSSKPARSRIYPPERLADKAEPGAHKRVDFPLFH
jgi:C-terminal peptidase prc